MEKIELGNITAYNSDYRDVLPLYPDGYFDLLYDDPPYGINADNPTKKPCKVKQRNGSILDVKQPSYKEKHWDSLPPSLDYFSDVFRKSKEQIIWGVNFFDYALKGGRIVWDKLNGQSDQFDGEIAYCSLHNRIDIVYYLWAGMIQGKHCSRELSKALLQKGNKKLNEKRRHSTQKPLLLEKYMLNTYAKPGFKVLVCHGGSLNSAIACHLLGLECVICEIDTEYFEDGVREIKRVQSQKELVFEVDDFKQVNAPFEDKLDTCINANQLKQVNASFDFINRLDTNYYE